MAIALTCKCGRRLRFRTEYAGKPGRCSCGARFTIAGERVPDHEVFISYSVKDKHAADAICTTLESRRIRCWIAPRDVRPGAWADSIVDAIGESRLLVLVLSSHANASSQVIREVERAVSKGVIIVPFRIDDVPLSRSMEYFIATVHWLDAFTGPLEEHVERLAGMVQGLLAGTIDAAAFTPGAPPWRWSWRRVVRSPIALTTIASLLTLVGLTLWLALRTREPPTPPVDLVATAPLSGGACLEWQDRSRTEIGFHIQRRDENATAWQQVGGVQENFNTFVDTSAREGHTYQYQVVAYNGSGVSAPTNVARCTVVKDAPAPQRPWAPRFAEVRGSSSRSRPRCSATARPVVPPCWPLTRTIRCPPCSPSCFSWTKWRTRHPGCAAECPVGRPHTQVARPDRPVHLGAPRHRRSVHLQAPGRPARRRAAR